jgi:hypothetical protein
MPWVAVEKSHMFDGMGTVWSYLYPQNRPYKWWNWHDSYVPDAAPEPKWVEVSDAGEAVRK